MSATPYCEFCEKLWDDWWNRRLDISPFVQQEFDIDAAVEPYIRYGASARPLVVLLTNPGNRMDHQERGTIAAAEGPIKPNCSYADIATELGKYYPLKLKGAARRRIESLFALAASLGYDGYLAVESCPFHSKSLRKKKKLIEAYATDPLLKNYRAKLREFLQARPVVIVSAVSSKDSLCKESVLSGWLTWQVELAGIDRSRAEFLPLLTKGERTTCAALVDFVEGVPKVLIRMMSGNHLPSEKNLKPLVDRIA